MINKKNIFLVILNSLFFMSTIFSQDDANTLDAQLKTIMQDIHYRCEQEGTSDSGIDYAKGANVAAFRRVADAMVAQGV